MWLQCDQFTNSQIPVKDLQLLREQHSSCLRNHPVSERSKAPGCSPLTPPPVGVGDLVYIASDGSKNRVRDRYLVVSIDSLWCNVRKFAGSQLRSTSYRVNGSECYRVSEHVDHSFDLSRRYNADSYCEDVAEEPCSAESFNEETGPVPVPPHPPSSFVPVVPDELTTLPDPQEAVTCSDSELSPALEGTAPYSAMDGPPTHCRDSLTPHLSSDDFDVPFSEQTSSSASSGLRRSSRPTGAPLILMTMLLSCELRSQVMFFVSPLKLCYLASGLRT